MDLYFIFKLVVVLIFLVMFLRNSKIVWGIGLLTVSTAFLLDTIWTTFGREEVLADVGFFFYIITGALFAGAAIWFWSVLRPFLAVDGTLNVENAPQPKAATPATPHPAVVTDGEGVYGDSRDLFETMREQLSPRDLRDVIFDLQLSENDVIAPNQEMVHTVARIIARAREQEKMADLALAVERILTPVPPESLPRREKLSASSPPTVLRHFLLAHYTLEGLRALARKIGVDYEQFEHNNKSDLARNLLLYLQRRNGLGQLVDCLHEDASASIEEE